MLKLTAALIVCPCLAFALCGPRAPMVEALASAHGERQVIVAQITKAKVFEFWASPDGTWTAFATHADGTSCVIASGTGWGVRQIAKADEEPA